MQHRVVTEEILDTLPPDHPDAIRSRRDLHRVNFLLGGKSWILSSLEDFRDAQTVVELGSGDGALIKSVKNNLPHVRAIAVDLVPRPGELETDIEWAQCNVMDFDLPDDSTIIIVNLFLHHLLDEELLTLGKKWTHARGWLIAEPLRSAGLAMMGKVMYPFINHVTRYDMKASIRAGFRSDELPRLLGSNWNWKHRVNMFGNIRYRGERKSR